jgi:ribosomal protein L16/L10AE
MSNPKLKPFLPCVNRTPTKNHSIGLLNNSITTKSYIISSSSSFLTKNQIESCKKILNRILKKNKIKYSVVVQYSLIKTKKSIGSRMGKGKGKVSDRVAFVKKHSVLFEFNNLPLDMLKHLVYKIRYKLPISISWKSSLVDKQNYI